MLQPTVPAWFEIPSRDLDRAVRFYESVLDTRLAREDMGPMRMAVFPHQKPAPTGAVVRADGYEPAEAGTVVYLSLDDVRPALARVGEAGGAVLLPVTELPEGMGVFAQIRDTEGNRVGLFSPR
jgi:predicted enzyme related to lactoylglutathione lyase